MTYLEPPHVPWVSCCFQAVLIALEEEFEEESGKIKNHVTRVGHSTRCCHSLVLNGCDVIRTMVEMDLTGVYHETNEPITSNKQNLQKNYKTTGKGTEIHRGESDHNSSDLHQLSLCKILIFSFISPSHSRSLFVHLERFFPQNNMGGP